jgi:DNA-binding LacI/PurR family transcriptional regulator
MAIGLLRACAECRVRVPRDLSIVGWDDVPYASLVTPPLTTVRVPRYELGRAAAASLLDLMADRPAAAHGPLPLQLIRRQSCRRVARS